MKKRFRKMISMLLAAAMVLSMGLTGLAAEIDPLAHTTESTTGSITINNAVSGEQYTIYQIFDLTYADYTSPDTESTSYSYKVLEAWQDFFLTGEGAEYITVNSDGYVTGVVDDFTDNSSAAAEFAKAALAYAEDKEISGTTISFTYDSETGTTTTTKCRVINGSISTSEGGITTASINIDELDLGYYLVGTSLGSLCMLTSTDPDAEINEKNTTPSLEKYVKDITQKDAESDYTQNDNADVIDTLQYEIIINNASNSHNLCVHDVIDDDMILVEDEDNIFVYVYLNGNALTGSLVASSNYSLTVYDRDNTPANWDGCCFEITFNDTYLESLSSSDQLYVIYNVTLNEKSEWEGDVHDFHNEAYLTYGYATETPPVATDTYSYGFQIWKYTGTLEESVNLANASFVIKYIDDNKTTYYATFDQSTSGYMYILTGWVTDKGNATVLVTPESGMISVEGFDPGTTYYIEETAAPDGYNKLTSDVKVNLIVSSSSVSTFHLEYTYEETTITTNDGDHKVSVLNNAGSILPGTGGMGTTIFYIVGIVLMIGAAAFFVARKRISKEE